MDEIITFSPINPNQVLQPHKDAIILTLGINGFDIRRVLINPGNSVDLLQMLAYRQIRLLSPALENLRRILSRFNGASTTSLGDVVLAIQAGLVT